MSGADERTTVVFYDGVCGLCDRFVRFLLRRDRAGRLRFAPLQSELARRELTARGHNPEDLDTVFVLTGWSTATPRLFSRSEAVLRALEQLGPGWRGIARLGAIVPSGLSDRIYDAVAKRRYGVFGRFEACPLPRPEWRDRFLDVRVADETGEA